MIKEKVFSQNSDFDLDVSTIHRQVPLEPRALSGERKSNRKRNLVGGRGWGWKNMQAAMSFLCLISLTFYLPGERLPKWSNLQKT